MLGTPIWPNMRVPGPRLKNPSAIPETGSTVYDLHPRRITKVAVSPQLFKDPDC